MNDCSSALQQARETDAFVRGVLPDAEGRMQAIEDDYANVKKGLLSSQGIIRISKNQRGILDANGTPMHFQVNGAAEVTFSEVFKVSPTGTAWVDRPDEEREMLQAMGFNNLIHYHPSGFSVLRMQWSNADIGDWAFFQRAENGSAMSHGSYAKLIDGSFTHGGYLHGATNKWSQCGYSHGITRLGYNHPHPILGSAEGEVLFCLAGSVLGQVGFDKDKPSWGYFDYFEAVAGE